MNSSESNRLYRFCGEFVGDSFDNIFRDLLWHITRHPEYVCSPRGQKINECLATTLVLTNPYNRFISNKNRETNYGFGVGEFLWYWQGKKDLKTMLYYNKRMEDFSDDGETLNSCYGYLLRNARGLDGNEINQWELAKNTLLNDKDSRRCVLQIHQPTHQSMASRPGGTRDVPCTLSMQFFIRNGQLDLHVHMRSNDIIWGLTYDLFSFTLFQECMLLELQKHNLFSDLKMGKYYHTAGSLHLYERHFKLADQILNEYGAIEQLPRFDVAACEEMKQITSLNDLKRLCDDEELLRTKEIHRIDESLYNDGLRWMAGHLNIHREKRDARGIKFT